MKGLVFETFYNLIFLLVKAECKTNPQSDKGGYPVDET